VLNKRLIANTRNVQHVKNPLSSNSDSSLRSWRSWRKPATFSLLQEYFTRMM